MRAFTVKCVVKNIKDFCKTKHYELKFEDSRQGHEYVFEITRSGITLSYGLPGEKLRQEVDNIDMLKLPDVLTTIGLEEKSFGPDGKKVIDHHKLEFRYEAQLFIKLFRIMKERVYFTVLHNNQYFDCYSFEGKIFYVEETDTQYKVISSDLFKLNQTHEGYLILNVNSLSQKMDYENYMSQRARVARDLGKEYVRVRDQSMIKV
jgi:hemin uptake protein HemP